MRKDTRADHRRPRAGDKPIAQTKPHSESAASRTRAAKLIARAGLCSRREAEVWIAEGRVALNGAPLTDPAVNINRNDKITVDGKPLAEPARTRLFLFHKPCGLVTTERDPQGRTTIFDYLRQHWPDGPRVVSVGRLDINSEGLLLLTNDGGLARVLELPATGWTRRYRVRAKGETSQAVLDGLRDGVTIEGMNYASIEAVIDRVQGANCWLTMALREGKNREIKRVLESIGLSVNRLIRVSYGPFQLGDLAEGMVDEVPTRVLRDQLGSSLAKSSGADFTSPLYGEGARKEGAAIPDGERARREDTEISTPRLRREHAHQRSTVAQPRARSGPAAIEPKPLARRRKHISALRAKYDEKPVARKRTEYGQTVDRAGRTVPIERRIAATGEAERQVKRPPKKPAKLAAHGPRNLKEVGRERQENLPRRGREKAAFGNRSRPPAGGGPKPGRPRRKS